MYELVCLKVLDFKLLCLKMTMCKLGCLKVLDFKLLCL